MKSVLLQEGEKKAAAARKRQRKDKDQEGKATDAKPKRAKVCVSATLPLPPPLQTRPHFSSFSSSNASTRLLLLLPELYYKFGMFSEWVLVHSH